MAFMVIALNLAIINTAGISKCGLFMEASAESLPTPTVIPYRYTSTKATIDVYGAKDLTMVDKVVINIYENNRLFKSLSPDPSPDVLTEVVVEGLKPNTKYVVKAHFEGGNMSSAEQSAEFKTTARMPSTSYSGREVQRLLKKMKKNKSFVFYFDAPLAHEDVYKWETTVTRRLAQYDKYTVFYKHDDTKVPAIVYTYDKAKAAKANKLAPQINKIIKGAKKKKGVREKVKYVNSKMCKMASYDYDTLRKKDAGLPYSKDAFTAYGVFVRKKAVCAGYAEAFSAIMYQLKIPCREISRDGHRWNQVRIGKTWYHVDVTWNDCSKDKTKYLLKKRHK